MENNKNQRLLYDTECKDCKLKEKCEWVDKQQCCRGITDKLRVELHNNRKQRKIVAKISITMEYVFSIEKQTKIIAEKGTFVLQEPYKFAEPFLRSEIQGKDNGGTFSTKIFNWD